MYESGLKVNFKKYVIMLQPSRVKPGNLTSNIDRHATISWEKSVFFQRKSVSIRILHLCNDVSRKCSRDSYLDAVMQTNCDIV